MYLLSKELKGWHIYPQATANMYIRMVQTTASLKFTCNNSTVQGHLYWNTSQELGFLSHAAKLENKITT